MVNISCKNNSPREEEVKNILLDILENVPRKYIFTPDIIIEEKVVPHSHPILTLNTRNLNNPDIILSTFIHEQIHWYLQKIELQDYYTKLESLFPNLGAGAPNWGDTLHSSYLHIIVNFLEIYILKKIIGVERAKVVLTSLKDDIYREIYNIVDIHNKELEELFTPILI